MDKKRVGIVEDEPLSTMFVRFVLERLGYETVFEVSSAAKAMDSISETPVDILFLDINILGPKDGIALGLELRERYKELKIIFITAYTDTQTLKEASLARPSFFLAKPFDEKDIEIALTMSLADSLPKYDESKIVYSLCPSTKAPMREGEYLQISPLEKRIISRLMRSKGTLVCYDELIIAASCGDSLSIGSLRNTIMRLRKKLPELRIETIKDLGYKLSCCDGVVILA